MTTLLGIDVGTTHTKVGIFRVEHGHISQRRLALRTNPTRQVMHGVTVYGPEVLWDTVCDAIAEVTARNATDLTAVGVSSMAETGLLVDARSGKPRTPLIPWFERCAAAEAARIAQRRDPVEHLKKTGLRADPKAGLAKLLWLRDGGAPLAGAAWLSVADYVVHHLTGAFCTDPTLAVRTHAYDMACGDWDAPWLEAWHLTPQVFPRVKPTGTIVGVTRTGTAPVGPGIPVVIAGHDHVCGAFAAGISALDTIFDSMGTAETLIGAFETRPLTERDFETGLIFGPYVLRDRRFWMSSLSASGGSIEWLRGLLGDPPLTYEQLEALLDTAPCEPTGILYIPYLNGRGAPHPDPRAQGALFGLTESPTRDRIARAVLEGTAYEMEAGRVTAESHLGSPVRRIVAAGGGTRNPHWMQIKADLAGTPIEVLSIQEATVLGAALLAGLGSGIFSDVDAAQNSIRHRLGAQYIPDPERHRRYQSIFTERYLPLQSAVLTASRGAG